MKNQKLKPIIYVGSSNKAEKINEQVRSIIENLGGKVIWWQDIPKPRDNIVDALVSISPLIDGALLIAAPDDPTINRLMDCMSPRDNIDLKLAFFTLQLGKHRTGIVQVVSPSQSSASLPSNFHGLRTIEFSPDKPENNESNIEGWLEDVLRHVNEKKPLMDELIELLEKVGSLSIPCRENILKLLVMPFKSNITQAIKGEIYLSPVQYYLALTSEMDNAASKNEILAVATLPSLIWIDDHQQQEYLKRNLKASERGANIRRLFILSDDQWKQMGPILKEQIDKGIEIRKLPPSLHGEFSRIEDMVLFKDTYFNESHAYLAELAKNSTHIGGGHLILYKEKINELKDDFDTAWAISTEINSKNIPKFTMVKK